MYSLCLLSVCYSIAHLLLVESARGLCGGFVIDGVVELWIGPPLAVVVGVLYVAGGGGLSVGVTYEVDLYLGGKRVSFWRRGDFSFDSSPSRGF